MLIHEDTVLDGWFRAPLELHMDECGHGPRCEITESAIVGSYVLACDNSVVHLHGGRICLELVGTDESRVTMTDGWVGGINSTLHAVVHLKGGHVDEELFVSYGGTLHWSGGDAGGSLRVATTTAMVHIYGRALSFGPGRTIWGTLVDGTLVGPQPYELLFGAHRDQIILHSDDNMPGRVDRETGQSERVLLPGRNGPRYSPSEDGSRRPLTVSSRMPASCR